MKIAILSDLHIPNAKSELGEAFTALLDDLRTREQINELWLLGDIFDLLIGPFQFWERRHSEILRALAALSQAGCRILWLEGNHDFHFAKAVERLDIEVRDEVMAFEIGTPPRLVQLAHGDLVNPRDSAYLKWRQATRNPRYRKILSRIPDLFAERVLLPLAQSVSQRSRAQAHPAPGEIKKMYRVYADEQFQKGFTAIFLGHCHVEDFYTQGQAFYLNLGSTFDGSLRYALWNLTSGAFPNVQIYRKIKS